MTEKPLRWWRVVGTVLVDPVAAIRSVLLGPNPWRLAALLALALSAVGLATLPRQLGLLHLGLAFTGEPAVDAQLYALRAGVSRLIVVDRLLPQPGTLLGGCLLVLAAEPVLLLPRERRRALVAATILGLAPLIIGRIGELAITYLAPITGAGTAGDAISAPHRFATGPRLLWMGGGPAPEWLELLDARANLISVWCGVLWSLGLRELDGGPWAMWHVALPFGCLLAGGLVSWALAPVLLPLVLR